MLYQEMFKETGFANYGSDIIPHIFICSNIVQLFQFSAIYTLEKEKIWLHIEIVW